MSNDDPKGLLEKAQSILDKIKAALLEQEQSGIFLPDVKPDPIILNQQLTVLEQTGETFSESQLEKSSSNISFLEAREKRATLFYNPVEPQIMRISRFEASSLEELIERIDWEAFLQEWDINLKDETNKERANALLLEANKILDMWCKQQRELDSDCPRPCALYAIFPACSTYDDQIKLFSWQHKEIATFPFFRCEYLDEDGVAKSLCDYIAPGIYENQKYKPTDYIGFFVASIGSEIDMIVRPYEKKADEHTVKMISILSNRLVSALSVVLQEKIAFEFWGYAKQGDEVVGISPVPGYPSLPDLRHLKTIFNLLSVSARTGVYLHNSMSLKPTASICGFHFAHPQSKYFSLGEISMEQIEDYAKRSKTKTNELLSTFVGNVKN